MTSPEKYVREFISSHLFQYIPSVWQIELKRDLTPWITKKMYIDQQLLPVLISSGIYVPIKNDTDFRQICIDGKECQNMGDFHRDTNIHPCCFGPDCKLLQRNDARHKYRYIH